MNTRKKAKRFATAVVVTLAASGCGGAHGSGGGGGTNECCHNPPPIMTFTPLESGDRVSRNADGECHETRAATGSTELVTCPSGLPGPGSIWRQGEQCMQMPEMQCPPPSEATCNPPPPMPVPCP